MATRLDELDLAPSQRLTDAGILNVFDAEPSINPEFPEYPDETLGSIRGRTFFVTVKKVW